MLEINRAFSAICWNMSWLGHCLLLLLPTALSYVDSGRQLPPVFWNSSNTMFQSSNNYHIIDVNLGDRLNILCPHYPDGTISNNQWEYYLIYMVDKYNYEVCVINDTSNKIVILNCSNPESLKFFTLLIFEFQPIPGIPDFQMGRDYYFISTSGGRKFNINNQYEGACKEHQMKMMLRVRPKVTDTEESGFQSNVDFHPHTHQPKKPMQSTTVATTAGRAVSVRTSRRPDYSHTDKSDDDGVFPDLDDFPGEETIIKAGDGPNRNSGIIADDRMENSGESLHYRHSHRFLFLSVILSFNLLLSFGIKVR